MKEHDSMWIKLSEQIHSLYMQKEHILYILIQSLGNDHILCNYKYYKYDDFITMLYRIIKQFYPYNIKYITVNNIKYNIETLLTPGKSEYSIYKTAHIYESPPNKLLFLDDKLYIERYSIHFKSLINDLLFECTMFKSITDYDAFTRELLRIRNIITEFHRACMELSTLDCPIPDELCNSIHRDVIRFDSEWL